MSEEDGVRAGAREGDTDPAGDLGDAGGDLEKPEPHRKGPALKPVVARACLLMMFACSGCVAAVPVATGIAGAVPAVRQQFEHGEEDSYWIARFDDVVNASLQAQEKLSMKIKEKTIKEKHAKLTLADDRDEEISLLIERLTDTVTRVHFVTGSQAFEGFAHLFSRQIVQELKDKNAFVVQWTQDNQ